VQPLSADADCTFVSRVDGCAVCPLQEAMARLGISGTSVNTAEMERAEQEAAQQASGGQGEGTAEGGEGGDEVDDGEGRDDVLDEVAEAMGDVE
jgi:hypothetical protein